MTFYEICEYLKANPGRGGRLPHYPNAFGCWVKLIPYKGGFALLNSDDEYETAIEIQDVFATNWEIT